MTIGFTYKTKLVSLFLLWAVYTPATFRLRSVYVPNMPPKLVKIVPLHAVHHKFLHMPPKSVKIVPLHAFHYKFLHMPAKCVKNVQLHTFHYKFLHMPPK